jgi:hypothetical protein
MASFTDTLVGFNPYIAQIPVDDYVRVGMQKQAEYNQGVTKVQNYIDSVSGIEVIKDEHKQYLNKRVNQLQGEVSKIVGEDFSRQQLVNSVGHLTSQIGTDPIIQNAEISTQRYKQGIAEMKRAQTEGKSSPSNEWYFQSQVSNWLNDKDINSTLNASYTPYTDVNKKALEAIKSVHPDAKIEEIPFVRGIDGQVVLDKDGQPKIDMAMIKKEVKGVEPERIEAAIKASLDQNDLRQLQIDGMYNYRGYDKVAMKRVADDSYNYKLSQINDTIKGLQVERMGHIGDAAYVKKIDDTIKNLSNRAEQYQQGYKRDIQYLDSNLDGYKSNLYMQNYLSKFGDGFAYAENSLTYENNPYFMAAERKRENDIKWQEFLVNKQFQSEDLKIKWEKLGIDREELEIKRMEAEAKLAKLKPGQTPLELTGTAISEPIDQKSLESITADNFVNNVQSKSDAIDSQKMALLAQVRPDLVKVVRNPDGLTKRYEYNVEGKDPGKVKAEAEATVLKLRDDFDKGNPVDDATKTFFTNVGNTSRDVENSKYALSNLQKEADKTWSVEPLLKKYNNFKLTSGSGAVYDITPKQVMDFNNHLSTALPSSGGPNMRLDDQAASRVMLTPTDKLLYSIYKRYFDGGRLNDTERKLIDHINNINTNVNVAAEGVVKGRDTYLNNAVRDITGATQPVGFPLKSFKTEDKGEVLAAVTPLFNSIVNSGKSNESPLYDAGDIRDMLSGKDKDQTYFTLEAKGGDKYAIGLHNEKVAKGRREIEITKDQAEQFFGAGRFLDDFQAIRTALQLSKGTGRVTTDVQGKGLESAFSLNNGQITDYGVRYHVEDPLKTGNYQIRLYIYDKKGDKQWHETALRIGQLLDEGQVTTALSNLSNSEIQGILNQNK